MKTIQEQIEVMQHYSNGGEIEYFCRGLGWTREKCPVWNWSKFDYRIKEVADPYAALKEANKRGSGKQIRLRTYKPWYDAGHDWKFDAPADAYEIRNKPRNVKLLACLICGQLIWLTEDYANLEGLKRMPNQDIEGEVEE